MEIGCIDTLAQNCLEKENEGELRVFCWNIERGYVLEELVNEMRTKNPDVLLLQEVDNGNIRTLKKDCAKEIAKGLGMKYYVYGVEFVELESIRRTPVLQGGGTHGNAIISRFPIKQAKVIHLPIAYNWGNSLRQPREGNRIAVTCIVESNFGDIGCVSVHLENCCSPIDRRNQFRYLIDTILNWNDFPKDIIIGGDINTFCNGLARMYAINIFSLSDIWERIRTLGYSESYIWKTEMSDLVGKNGLFYDPFDIKKDFTISQVKGFFTAKIDWLMSTSKLSPIDMDIGGNIDGRIGQRHSDHKWIYCTYILCDS